MKRTETQISLLSLVEGVRRDEPKAKELLYLFLKRESFPNLERYILNRGGHAEDAKDLFQEAVMVLIAAIREEKFRLRRISGKSNSSQLGAYLMTVVKNLWKKELRWRSREPIRQQDFADSELLISELPAQVLGEVFLSLESECRQILSLYFKDCLSPRLIAGRLDQKTAVLKKQLQGCIDNLVRGLGRLLENQHPEKLSELLTRGMEDLEERCRTILTKFYYEKQSMSELAAALGYANAHVVTEQKNRCMKRLNEAIANRLLNGKSKPF